MWFFDRYNYSPAATILLSPLSLFPVNLSEFLFTAISVFSLWLTATYILASMRVKLSWPYKLLLFALVLKTFPVKLTLILGQINLIILLLIIASFYFYKQKKNNFSGILLGLATIIKLTPAPLILFFILKKQWGTLNWFLFTLIGLTIAGVAIFGLDLTSYYYFQHMPALLSEVTKATVKTDYMNQGVAAFLGRFGIFDSLATIIRYLISAALFYQITRRRLEAWTGYSLLLIVTMLLLPLFVWQHHFVFLIPAWLLLVSQAYKRPKSWATPAAITTYILLNLFFKNPNLVPNQHPLIATHFLLTTVFIFAATYFVTKSNKSPT